jgi:hypothetical protein
MSDSPGNVTWEREHAPIFPGALRANDHWRAARQRRCANSPAKSQILNSKFEIFPFCALRAFHQKRAARDLRHTVSSASMEE